MKLLITGFKGAYNSSKILLDKIKSQKVDKLYVENDFDICIKQLEEKLMQKRYDLILSFGQKPVTKSICIESVSYQGKKELYTDYQYSLLYDFLKEKNYRVKVSKNPGNFLCNHIYFHGLHIIEKKKLLTKMIFVHTPYLKNIEDMDDMGSVFSEFIELHADTLNTYNRIV